jgi:hypothetical protein
MALTPEVRPSLGVCEVIGRRRSSFMTERRRPDWADKARHRATTPIDHYWRPEEGSIEGVLIARTREPNRFRPGAFNDLAIVEEPGSKFHTAIRIRAGLDDLLSTKIGTRIFVGPHSPRPVPNGTGSVWSFEVFVEDLTDDGNAPGSPADANG